MNFGLGCCNSESVIDFVNDSAMVSVKGVLRKCIIKVVMPVKRYRKNKGLGEVRNVYLIKQIKTKVYIYIPLRNLKEVRV